MILRRCKTEQFQTVIRKSWLKDGKAYRYCWEYCNADPRIREWGNEKMELHKEYGPAREYKAYNRDNQYYIHEYLFTKEAFDLEIAKRKALKANQ